MKQAPTPAPTPAQPAVLPQVAQVAAVGDPHLVNVFGQHFDIFQPGTHTLLEIPRGTGHKTPLLYVRADVSRSGGKCADMYFKTVNISGRWAHTHRVISYSVRKEMHLRWKKYGPVEIKITWGHTSDGVRYLNFLAKHVKNTKYHVGGLLGEDDHTTVATASARCKKTISL